MRHCFIFLVILGLFLAGRPLPAQSVWDVSRLRDVRARYRAGDRDEASLLLMRNAERALLQEPLSVMMKEGVPVSGDKHDYMSLARYFWPDPTKPDGLPYVNRDGVSNPELEKYDRNTLGRMASSVTTLSLAWYLSGDERFAAKAVSLLRVWFLDEETRMNPHLKYAQVARGHDGDRGRSYGLIDSYSFVEMLDAVQLLEKSRSFPRKDRKALRQWFSSFLDWYLESPQGQEEATAANNHSVAYDVQAIAYALYIGRTKFAKEYIESFPARRILTQVEPDGSQPEELRRTLAFGYSQYNLSHMLDIRQMALRLKIKLDDGPEGWERFFRGLDFLLPYASGSTESWPYLQISDWQGKRQAFCRDLYRTSLICPWRTDYRQFAVDHLDDNRSDLFSLLYFDASR